MLVHFQQSTSISKMSKLSFSLCRVCPISPGLSSTNTSSLQKSQLQNGGETERWEVLKGGCPSLLANDFFIPQKPTALAGCNVYVLLKTAAPWNELVCKFHPMVSYLLVLPLKSEAQFRDSCCSYYVFGYDDYCFWVGSGMGKSGPYLGGANPDGIWRRALSSRVCNWVSAAMAVFHSLCLFYLQIWAFWIKKCLSIHVSQTKIGLHYLLVSIMILVFLRKILTQEWGRSMDDCNEIKSAGIISLMVTEV